MPQQQRIQKARWRRITALLLVCFYLTIQLQSSLVQAFTPPALRTVVSNNPVVVPQKVFTISTASKTKMSLTSSSSIPSISTLAGKFLPYVPAFPHSSIDAAITSYPGDLVILASFVVLPKVLKDVKIPRQGRKILGHLQVAGNAGGRVFLTSVLDTVVAALLGKLSFGGNVKKLVFLLGWWLPSRYGLVMNVKEEFRLVKEDEIKRNWVPRLASVATAVGVIALATKVASMEVSEAMQLILPAFALLLS